MHGGSHPPRYRRVELQHLPIRKLKELMPRGDYYHAADRDDLIRYLIDVGAVDLMDRPLVELRMSDMHRMSVAQLRRCMNEQAGIFFDSKQIVEKQDMIDMFVRSGKLTVLSEPEDDEQIIANNSTSSRRVDPPANLRSSLKGLRPDPDPGSIQEKADGSDISEKGKTSKVVLNPDPIQEKTVLPDILEEDNVASETKMGGHKEKNQNKTNFPENTEDEKAAKKPRDSMRRSGRKSMSNAPGDGSSHDIPDEKVLASSPGKDSMRRSGRKSISNSPGDGSSHDIPDEKLLASSPGKDSMRRSGRKSISNSPGDGSSHDIPDDKVLASSPGKDSMRRSGRKSISNSPGDGSSYDISDEKVLVSSPVKKESDKDAIVDEVSGENQKTLATSPAGDKKKSKKISNGAGVKDAVEADEQKIHNSKKDMASEEKLSSSQKFNNSKKDTVSEEKLSSSQKIDDSKKDMAYEASDLDKKSDNKKKPKEKEKKKPSKKKQDEGKDENDKGRDDDDKAEQDNRWKERAREKSLRSSRRSTTSKSKGEKSKSETPSSSTLKKESSKKKGASEANSRSVTESTLRNSTKSKSDGQPAESSRSRSASNSPGDEGDFADSLQDSADWSWSSDNQIGNEKEPPSEPPPLEQLEEHDDIDDSEGGRNAGSSKSGSVSLRPGRLAMQAGREVDNDEEPSVIDGKEVFSLNSKIMVLLSSIPEPSRSISINQKMARQIFQDWGVPFQTVDPHSSDFEAKRAQLLTISGKECIAETTISYPLFYLLDSSYHGGGNSGKKLRIYYKGNWEWFEEAYESGQFQNRLFSVKANAPVVWWTL